MDPRAFLPALGLVCALVCGLLSNPRTARGEADGKATLAQRTW